MRFAIAASILAQALPAASDESAKKRGLTELFAGIKNKKLGLNVANEIDEETLALAREQGFKLGAHGRGDGTFKKKYNNGPLMNKKFLEAKAPGTARKECDPKIAESATADVGILGCGDHQYCMESGYSKLGGFCVMDDDSKSWDVDEESHRMLQVNGTNDTSVCIYDYTNTSAAIECPSGSGCFEPCNTTCFNLTSYFYDNFVTSRSYEGFCFNVYEPFSTYFCYIYTYVNGTGPSCYVTYAGQDCASCSSVENGGETCTLFDCTNVQGYFGTGTAGNTCLGDIPLPLQSEVWIEALLGCLEFCDICPGGNITDFYADIPYFNQTCGGLYADASLYPFPTDYCGASQIAAALYCGCDAGPPLFICSACPGGGMVSNPDFVVDLTAFDFGNATCAEIERYAPFATAFFGIDATTCPFFQNLIVEPCGCTVPMTPAPVDPMTPAPVDPMAPAPMAAMTPAPMAAMTPAPMAAMTPAPMMAADPTDAPAATPTDAPTSGASNILPLAVAGLSMAVAAFFSG